MFAVTPGGTVRRAAPVVVLVVGACAVVAAGATGVGLLVPPLGESAIWMWAIRIAGALAGLAAVRILLDQRRRLRSATQGREDPALSAMIVAGGIMSVVFLLALVTSTLDNRDRSPGPPGTRPPSRESDSSGERQSGSIMGGLGLGRGAPDRRVPGEPETRSQQLEGIDLSIPARTGSALLLLLVLAAVLLGLASLRRHLARLERPPPEAAALEEEPEPELYDPTVETITAGRGPRRLVTAAYHRLLAALAEAGAPRRLQEAPHEHLHRALGPLGVNAAPMHRLTDLHVLAQFSERPITDHHVISAEQALEEGLTSLRRTRMAGRVDA